jgi:hypothetical protein
MPLFRRRRDPEPAPVAADDHAVITHLPLSGDGFGAAEEREVVQALEERITQEVTQIGGEHDGDEFGAGEAVLYTYGPDADALFDVIQRCLDGFELREGAYAIKRYGRADDPSAREVRMPLT